MSVRLTTSGGLWVEPVASEPTCFDVQSESRPGSLRVDLARNDMVGECACEHFQFRKNKAFRLGTEAVPLLRCKHIEAAREACLDMMIAQHERSRGGAREEAAAK